MTKEQAEEIALRIQSQGLSYKHGHYHYGYTTLSYNREKSAFELKKEDMSFNMYNSTISYSYKTKEEFVAYILEYHKPSDFAK